MINSIKNGLVFWVFGIFFIYLLGITEAISGIYFGTFTVIFPMMILAFPFFLIGFVSKLIE